MKTEKEKVLKECSECNGEGVKFSPIDGEPYDCPNCFGKGRWFE